MRNKILFTVRRLMMLVLALTLAVGFTIPAYAAESKTPYQQIITEDSGATFTYDLFLTDQNGMSVTNPRKLSAGDKLYVEIRLTRNGYQGPSYDSYGIEFRLLTRGLTYNYDGATLRNGTQVHITTYMDGDSVGFAWYDMGQVGEPFNNPVLASSWSYTVENPSAVNITVPVALIYVTGDTEEHVPVGMARLYLDPNGGKLLGEDVSGEYLSGTKVTLPDAENGEFIFEGWSDGVYLYPAGSEYAVSGIVTLTAQWAGLVRDRYVGFILNGGTFVSEDPSGNYADGEIIIMPEATREGYRLIGWNDGTKTYASGEEYVVYNTVNLNAEWEDLSSVTDKDITDTDGSNGGVILALLAIAGLIFWLLWRSKLVHYSLVNGDVSLDYRNGNVPAEVEVILYDGEKEYHLNKSGIVDVKHRLQFIKNASQMAVTDIKPGIYKGKLLINADIKVAAKRCRIKVVDRTLDDTGKKVSS